MKPPLAVNLECGTGLLAREAFGYVGDCKEWIALQSLIA